MSYDIFFVRRDPGQTMEDALADVEDSYEGGDPGPLQHLRQAGVAHDQPVAPRPPACSGAM